MHKAANWGWSCTVRNNPAAPAVAAIPFAIVALTMVHQPDVNGALRWDVANALGYVCFALFLYLFVDVGSGPRQRPHQLMSYLAGATLLAHVLILWLPDPSLWSYLSWYAPAYMLAGIAAAVCVVLLIITSLPRWRRVLHARYPEFRRLHKVLSALLLGLCLWHMLGSGLYLNIFESICLAALSCAIAAHQLLSRDPVWPRYLTVQHGFTFTLMTIGAASLLFVGVRQWL